MKYTCPHCGSVIDGVFEFVKGSASFVVYCDVCDKDVHLMPDEEENL
jgi:transcription elongation factor Elf1